MEVSTIIYRIVVYYNCSLCGKLRRESSEKAAKHKVLIQKEIRPFNLLNFLKNDAIFPFLRNSKNNIQTCSEQTVMHILASYKNHCSVWNKTYLVLNLYKVAY